MANSNAKRLPRGGFGVDAHDHMGPHVGQELLFSHCELFRKLDKGWSDRVQIAGTRATCYTSCQERVYSLLLFAVRKVLPEERETQLVFRVGEETELRP